MFRRFLPIILTCVILAAHFLRSNNFLAMLLFLAAPLLLLIRRAWSLWVLQALAYLAALLWVFTTMQIVRQRLIENREWIGVVIILGLVAAFSIVSGLLLNSPVVKTRYPG